MKTNISSSIDTGKNRDKFRFFLTLGKALQHFNRMDFMRNIDLYVVTIYMYAGLYNRIFNQFSQFLNKALEQAFEF